MHNAKDMAIFADSKEVQQLNHTTHYIHAVINYLQYGVPHTLGTPASHLYVRSVIGVGFSTTPPPSPTHLENL